MRFEICLSGTVFREKEPSVGGLLPKMVQALATTHWWLEKPRALPRQVGSMNSSSTNDFFSN